MGEESGVKVWISRKRFKALERKVAVFEEAQLLVEDSIKSNEKLLHEVKKLREEILRIKILDANIAE